MQKTDDRARLQNLAEQHGNESWVDAGTRKPSHPSLTPYIASFSYSVGCIKDQKAKFITRAYPTVMTQLYFEFCGELSEVRDSRGEFAFGVNESPASATIQKRTYVKQGLGSWFDIYQLPSNRSTRPIKNLKVDLYPNALFQMFRLAPLELEAEDLQLPDLIGQKISSLMLEEMDAAVTGEELIAIVERYFSGFLLNLESAGRRFNEAHPRLPSLDDSLSKEAQRYGKSARWLQKRYSTVYGMSFKQMQNNLRFYEAHKALTHAAKMRQPINLTELAYRFEYFDQAHFIRDFKRYTGMTPGNYLRLNLGAESRSLFYW